MRIFVLVAGADLMQIDVEPWRLDEAPAFEMQIAFLTAYGLNAEKAFFRILRFCFHLFLVSIPLSAVFHGSGRKRTLGGLDSGR